MAQEVKLEVKEPKNRLFDEVISYSDFFKKYGEKSGRLLIQFYDRLSDRYTTGFYELNLLSFKEQIAYWDYKRPDVTIRDELARFPQEHGLIIAGYVDENNEIVQFDKRYYVGVFDFMTSKQKLDYEDFKRDLQAIASSRQQAAEEYRQGLAAKQKSDSVKK